MVAALTACSTNGDVFLDITFAPCEPLVLVPTAGTADAEMDSVLDAIEMWNAVANTGLTMEATPDARELEITFEDVSPLVHGVYDDEMGTILINRKLGDDHARAITVAHELGHAFGFFHNEASAHPSVMKPGNLELEPTPEDGEALSQAWGACPTE